MTFDRRSFCVLGACGLAWSAAASASGGLRFSICNETYGSLGFAGQCRLTRRTGYRGLEIAPFTLSDDPGTLSKGKLAECRRILSGEGLEFAGLHALLTAPKGLNITTPDAAIRRRSWELLRRLIDICAALGPDNVMVLGSGKQRSAQPGESIAAATQRLQDGLA
ncbi:MAG: sugar phosphate isomerase/epimerase family protein, partial [Bryobacteraceae bacterium]